MNTIQISFYFHYSGCDQLGDVVAINTIVISGFIFILLKTFSVRGSFLDKGIVVIDIVHLFPLFYNTVDFFLSAYFVFQLKCVGITIKNQLTVNN